MLRDIVGKSPTTPKQRPPWLRCASNIPFGGSVSAPVFLCGDDYLALPRNKQRWLIEDLIPTSGFVNMYGAPKTGKSFAALGMAHAISTEADEWLDFPVLHHGPVAYLQIDTAREDWADRILKMRNVGLNMNNVFICDMQLGPYPFNIFEQQEWLKEQLGFVKPVVVFLDTLRDLHPSDENDATQMKNVVTAITSACRPATIVLLSHSRKDNEFNTKHGDRVMADARGSSYVAGKMDVVIKMTGTDTKGATALTYQGRGEGSGRLKVKQAGVTGLVMLDGADAVYRALLKDTVKAMHKADPDVTVNAIADAMVLLTTHRAHRTIGKNATPLLAKACRAAFSGLQTSEIELTSDGEGVAEIATETPAAPL